MALTQIAHLYKITHTNSGRFYYGKHNGTTQSGYWGSGRKLKSLYKKYAKSEFTYEILVVSDVDYIYELEEKLVNIDMLKEGLCLNLTVGGHGVKFLSEEQLLKCSHTGKKRSDETKRKLSVAQSRRVHPKRSAEQKDKISIALKKFYAENAHPQSQESISKMKATKAKSPTGTGKWMNNGISQFKVKTEFVQEKLELGWVLGTLKKHVTQEYKEKLRQAALSQWKKKDNK